jgi:hypothetical protein
MANLGGMPQQYFRPMRPLPVYRGAYWQLVCADCGAELNRSVSAGPSESSVRHVEAWKDGCAWVARRYPTAGAPRAVSRNVMKAAGRYGVFVRKSPAAEPSASPPSPRSRGAKAALRWEAIKAEVIPRWGGGESLATLGKAFHISRSVLYHHLRRDGILRPRRPQLRDQDDAIYAAWQAGESQTAIAARIGFHVAYVSRRLRLLNRQSTALRQGEEEPSGL